MPSPKERRGKAPERSMSFNGRGGAAPAESLRRPRTLPDLRFNPVNGGFPAPAERKLTPTKVLFHVAIQGSVGNIQVLMSPDSKVKDLIGAALKQYVKERRRPVISSAKEDEFDLHYSQFSLESLDREEKLGALGSRSFFMCKRRMEGGSASNEGTSTSCCSKQAEKVKVASPFPWFKSILRVAGGP